MLKTILLFFIVVQAIQVSAQSIKETTVEKNYQHKALSDFLNDLKREYHVKVFVKEEWIANIKIEKDYSGETVEYMLNDLFLGTDLNFIVMYERTLIILKDPTQVIQRRETIQSAIKNKKKVVPFSLGRQETQTENKIIINGRVTETRTNDPIASVNITLNETNNGTTTNEKGLFKLTLVPGLYAINLSHLDYEPLVIDLQVYADGDLNIEMEKTARMLDEVIVKDRATDEVVTSRIGQIQLSPLDLKRSPALMGEADVIKKIQTLPGVTTVGEAAGGFNVRGGSVDQNLILYDGLPVYNSSHAFGFLSSFNAEAIRDAAFYRGGIPAEYGGRVSSVLDMKARDGNMERWGGNAGIGLITSNILVNGPIQKDKTSIAASVRTTYSDWLINSIRTNYADLRNSSVRFYDASLKLAHLINKGTRISGSLYKSHDSFYLSGDTTYQWNNFLSSISLDHAISNQLTSNFIIGLSSYNYHLNNDNRLTASRLTYQINTIHTSALFNYALNDKHNVNFGWQFNCHLFNPGNVKYKVPSQNNFSMDNQNSIENAIFFADESSITSKFNIEAGLRVPLFFSFGPAKVYQYLNGFPKSIDTIADTIVYRKLQPVKTYVGIEPRVSLRWNVSTTSSVKLGYNRIHQFLHLVTNTAAVTPLDVWQPSNYYFKPQRADQLSIGYYKDFKEKKYSAFVEAFYKNIDNILDFKDGAQLILNKQLETDLLQGRGYAYGIETFLEKKTGKLTATFNYTYSRSFRVITGSFLEESINRGKRYPSNFDQPHIMNFSWKIDLSRRYFFTGNFTYHTGRPISIPLSAFQFEQYVVSYFSARNQYRIPDYHRLDLALIVEGNHKHKQKWKSNWVISVYNVYGRKNPYSVFYKQSKYGMQVPYQLSIIGTVFPSVSYNVRF